VKVFKKVFLFAVAVSIASQPFANANPDAVVIPSGDLRIKGAGSGLVFPDGSIQYKAPAQVLLSTIKLAVGDTVCPNGGVSIQTGKDTNGNGILDSVEISTAQDICNGLVGAVGSAGTPGVTGAAGAAGTVFPWVNTTSTTQQAVSNTGYMANNSSQVSIMLPVAPSVGDTVKVTGIGAGGWKIAQNVGQSIITRSITQTLSPLPPADLGNWISSIASSADSIKLVAVSGYGQIYSSADSGASWTQRTAPSLNWTSVGSSTDGAHLLAAAGNGQLYTSTDSGLTWIPRATAQNWSSVASSSDGTKLVAVVSGGLIYTSTDSGVTWTPRATNQGWRSVASSSDGTKLAAGSDGPIYTSTDSGATWSPSGTILGWSSVASSSDGTKLVAVTGGQLYTSNNSGITWTSRITNQSQWQSVASSSDGSFIVATAGYSSGSGLYLSTNAGASWNLVSPLVTGVVVISASNGKMIAVDGNNQLDSMMLNQTTTGATGYISAGQYDTVELQYVGDNMFNILSSRGNPIAQ
jgi:photosystem II stability/assembly factor-like uncharacterized protein